MAAAHRNIDQALNREDILADKIANSGAQISRRHAAMLKKKEEEDAKLFAENNRQSQRRATLNASSTRIAVMQRDEEKHGRPLQRAVTTKNPDGTETVTYVTDPALERESARRDRLIAELRESEPKKRPPQPFTIVNDWLEESFTTDEPLKPARLPAPPKPKPGETSLDLVIRLGKAQAALIKSRKPLMEMPLPLNMVQDHARAWIKDSARKLSVGSLGRGFSNDPITGEPKVEFRGPRKGWIDQTRHGHFKSMTREGEGVQLISTPNIFGLFCEYLPDVFLKPFLADIASKWPRDEKCMTPDAKIAALAELDREIWFGWRELEEACLAAEADGFHPVRLAEVPPEILLGCIPYTRGRVRYPEDAPAATEFPADDDDTDDDDFEG